MELCLAVLSCLLKNMSDSSANAIAIHLHVPFPVLFLLLTRDFPTEVWQRTVFQVVNEITESLRRLNQKEIL